MATYTTLTNGSKGTDVKKLQQALVNAGYSVGKSGVDGIYGSSTAAAVKAYQKANGLSVDGIAGNKTLSSLYGSSKTSSTSSSSTASSSAKSSTTPSLSYNNFKVSDNTAAYKATSNQKQAELDALGDFKYDDYVDSDSVIAAKEKLSSLQAPSEYQSKWQNQLDEYIDKILNREDFSYDLNGDALYKQYKDQYTAQGKLAMMDTMGQAAAMTGGYGSSYSQGVGQQAYQGYLQQLNDRVPELYKLALDKYNREGEELYNRYGLLADAENQEYSRYRDTVSDYLTERDYLTDVYNNERSWNYGLWSDGYDRAYNEYQTKYNALTDAIDRADSNYWNGYNSEYTKYGDDIALKYQQERDAVSDAQWQAELDEAKRQYNESLTSSKSSGSSSGSGSNSGGSNSGNTSSGSGYNNGSVSSSNIKTLQKALGVTADGKWGSKSTSAAGGLSAEEAWKAYQNGTLKTADINAEDYADFDIGDWESYFAQIRQSEGKSAAEEELSYFTKNGIIPKNMITYAAIGARGSLGH